MLHNYTSDVHCRGSVMNIRMTHTTSNVMWVNEDLSMRKSHSSPTLKRHLISKWLQHYVTLLVSDTNHYILNNYCTDHCLGRTGGWLQMNRLSLRNNRLKLETSRELPITLEESIEEYASNE